MVRKMGYQGDIEICPEISIAITQTLQNANPDDLVLVTGSLYMLGEARNHWVPIENILLEAEKALDI